jgi:prepilin-type N-terminal cleavage/methylation domain-containing protein/prepilin-type processing-associated H-X9-DG protein
MRRRPAAFTLVEMLVVMAVILLLAGLLAPVLSRARAEARRTACKSQLSQLAKAVQIYLADHDWTYPALAARPSLAPGQARLRDALARYVRDERTFRCPADNLGFYENEGSSYEWNALLNGRRQDGRVEQIIGPSRTPMLYDYENFHPDPGTGGYGGKNVAFCDGSVRE